MASQPAPRWRSVAPDAIVWREWEGEFVLRNERTGSSHLLSPLAGSVLQVLLHSDRALTSIDIATRLGQAHAVATDADGCAAIDEVLSEFHRLGLAAPEPP